MSTTTTNTKKRKQTSGVWDYIEKVRINDVLKSQCTVRSCNHTFSINSSTSTLKEHLRAHRLFNTDDNQQRLSTSTQNSDLTLTTSPPAAIESFQARFESQLSDFIVVGRHSFSLVENLEFKKLISLCNPNLHLPSRKTIQRRVLAICNNMKENLKSLLYKRTSRVILTADEWSSRIYRGYSDNVS